MTQDPSIPAIARMTPEQIRALDNPQGKSQLIGLITPLTREQIGALPDPVAIAILGLQHNGCQITVMNFAKAMGDLQAYRLMPQLVVRGADGNAALNPAANFDGDAVGVENHEIRAALVLSARIAQAQGVNSLEGVRIEDLNRDNAFEIMGQITGTRPQYCPPEGGDKSPSR